MLGLSPDEWTAIELSLRIAIVATACALPFGIAIGWLLARNEFWGKTLLNGSFICRWCCRRSSPGICC